VSGYFIGSLSVYITPVVTFDLTLLGDVSRVVRCLSVEVTLHSDRSFAYGHVTCIHDVKLLHICAIQTLGCGLRLSKDLQMRLGMQRSTH